MKTIENRLHELERRGLRRENEEYYLAIPGDATEAERAELLKEAGEKRLKVYIGISPDDWD